MIAVARLIPACFTNGDKKTAHKHLGELVSNVCIFEQQAGGTFAVAFWAAPTHGLKLAAATFTGVFPHSPAACASLTYACEASKKMIMASKEGVTVLEAMSLWKSWSGLMPNGVYPYSNIGAQVYL